MLEISHDLLCYHIVSLISQMLNLDLEIADSLFTDVEIKKSQKIVL